jgi:hypothetical protein
MEVQSQPVELTIPSVKSLTKSIGKIPLVKSSDIPKAPMPRAHSARAHKTPKSSAKPKAHSAKAHKIPSAPAVMQKAPSVKSKARSVRFRDSALKQAIGKIHERKNARTTLKKIIEKTGVKKLATKIRSSFLQSVCPDSGACISLGKERKKILDFFNGFTKFEYLTNVQSIGKASSNGFVKELEYERDGYRAHAILKSSKTKDADNLMYEYFVGYIINRVYLNWSPCFIETYGRYKYKDLDAWRQVQAVGSGKIDLNSMLTPYDIMVSQILIIL